MLLERMVCRCPCAASALAFPGLAARVSENRDGPKKLVSRSGLTTSAQRRSS